MVKNNMNRIFVMAFLFFLSACAHSRYYFQVGQDQYPVEQASIHLKQFPYPKYIKEIIKKIDHNLEMTHRHDLNAIFFFRINRDGSINKNDITITKSSGDDFLNSKIAVAILNSAPFDPLPVGYIEDTLGVYLECSQK